MGRKEENEKPNPNCSAPGCKNTNAGGGLCEWHGAIANHPEKFDRLTDILKTKRHKQITFYLNELQTAGIAFGGMINLQGRPYNVLTVYRSLQARMIEYGVPKDQTFLKDKDGNVVPWTAVIPKQYALAMRRVLMDHVIKSLFGKTRVPKADIDPKKPITLEYAEAVARESEKPAPYWANDPTDFDEETI